MLITRALVSIVGQTVVLLTMVAASVAALGLVFNRRSGASGVATGPQATPAPRREAPEPQGGATEA
jgi:hypothetical protein